MAALLTSGGWNHRWLAGKTGISQARTRLGVEPVKKLYEAIVTPMAEPGTKGAWYRK